ncbi:iron uptake system protein EfeO [Tessaracoccus antarcticus]|uniref:Peptidase M75 family protein n=1 Tax=Tessaracoccus antarcticus TaxID=2479848 RepID=A0A3M0GAN2_9ACTN|nr:iron uptake system protein EfeO [Tessaracoccus antarcticus]RMB61974.1 peptidase M75 family protein [Tessaracoccus antarcticus]
MKTPLFAVTLSALALTLSACGLTEPNAPAASGGDGQISVSSTSEACDLSVTEVGSGNLAFRVKNEGTEVTEFYLYAEDGLRIVGEIENIGPGLTRDLVVRATAGDYVTACKPGMVGQGIRNAFTVTESGEDLGITGVDAADIEAAETQYAAYVRDQSQELVDATGDFLKAWTSGDDDLARRLYPTARQHWERIETVAESFGDLDPKMDLREADLEPGQEWTGWHRIEKDLWPPATGYVPLTAAERQPFADDLMANTEVLQERVQTETYTVSDIGNGAKGLLDEVAAGKITGEEDIWSHTDLYDFQANVDGARVAYEGIKPLLDVKDAALSTDIGERFDALQELLDGHRTAEGGFVFYDTVEQPQRKLLSDAVNALGEPLSKMTGAIIL